MPKCSTQRNRFDTFLGNSTLDFIIATHWQSHSFDPSPRKYSVGSAGRMRFTRLPWSIMVEKRHQNEAWSWQTAMICKAIFQWKRFLYTVSYSIFVFIRQYGAILTGLFITSVQWNITYCRNTSTYSHTHAHRYRFKPGLLPWLVFLIHARCRHCSATDSTFSIMAYSVSLGCRFCQIVSIYYCASVQSASSLR